MEALRAPIEVKATRTDTTTARTSEISAMKSWEECYALMLNIS